ncbi:MAG: hypothetical protein WCB99_14470 [Candidatus Cybelea sp.]
MRAELEDMRHTFELERSLDIDQWEQMLPQHQRDQLAARALIDSYGDPYRAATRLGFKGWGKYENKTAMPILQRIFGTPGCRELLERDLAEPEEARVAMVKRQVEIALYGPNEQSTHAFQALSRVLGWQKTPDVLVQHNRATTILALVTQKNSRGELPPETIEALTTGFLEHEPGAAVRIDSSSEIVDSAIGDRE